MFPQAEMDFLRASHVEHMYDEAVIRIESESANSFNEQIRSYIDGPKVVCGLTLEQGQEVNQVNKTVTTWDATIRLPVDVAVTTKDRIKVTKRHGLAWGPLEFEVVSPAEISYGAIVVKAKKVEI